MNEISVSNVDTMPGIVGEREQVDYIDPTVRPHKDDRQSRPRRNLNSEQKSKEMTLIIFPVQ